MMKNISKALGIADAKRDIPSPYLSANFPSKVTLWWINNHIWRGFKRPLSPTDIYTIIPEECSETRAKKLELNWNCLSKEEKRKKNSLLKAVMINDWKLLAISTLLILVGEIANFIQPFLITLLVSYFKSEPYVSERQAWGYAFGMVFLTVLYALFSTYGQYLGQVVAMRMRTSCTAMMARKASRLSSVALSEVSTATVINLLATDVEKFYNAATEFKGLFMGPFVLLAVLIYIAVEVELSVLPVLVFIVLMTALRLRIGHMAGLLRLKFAQLSDKRIKLTSEIIAAMKSIKAHCWEYSFANRAQDIRSKELKKAGSVMYLNGLNLILGMNCDKIVTFLLVVTFILTGHYVDYKLAVQVLTWMKMGQVGLLDFPIGFSMWKQMEASVSRMQDFLLAEEFVGFERVRKESTISKKDKDFLLAEEFVGFERVRKESTISKKDKVSVVLKNVSASWAIKGKDSTRSTKMLKATLLRSISTLNAISSKENFVASGSFSLHNINLEVRNGSLIGIVGPVGSGKTSLLLVILGNLPHATGSRRLKGKIAYVSQEPWIRADTIRNNILMGAKMERKRYQAVLEACALEKDIAAMMHGDATIIGERGSSLSGGQRSRISLARAVYKNADIYILDDPFSSLDSKVGTHIFHECVKGLLRQKLIIMATHSVHLLNYTDQVLVMKEGKVAASGTIQEVENEVDIRGLIKDPEHNIDLKNETADVFEMQDKMALVMNLFQNPNIKREHAHVPKKRATPFHVYLTYWRAGSGYFLLSIFCLLLLINQAMSVTGEWWLVYILSGKAAYQKSKVVDHNVTGHASHLTNFTLHDNSSFTVHDSHDEHIAHFAAATSSYPKNYELQQRHLGPYAAFVLIGFVAGFFSIIFGSLFTMYASKNLYNRMFTKVIWAPMHLFSSVKLGQMMNRFARDTGRMDDIIPITLNATFMTAVVMLAQMAYVCVVNAYVVVATLPFLLCLILFVLYCVRAIRDTKRLESEFRTPTFEHLNHLLDGLEVIRAYEMEATFIAESDSYLDRHTAAWHMYIGSMYWMKMRLQWLVSIYLAAVLIIEMATPYSADSATSLGLSLAYVLLFMHKIQYFANNSTSLDANMTSVEHVLEYESLDQEVPESDRQLPPGWPKDPSIEFKDVHLVYPGSAEHALNEINFTVKSGEKIGIVGRTGAGKTSLFNALLRLSDYEGSIKISGSNIKDIGLHQLRSNITFIQQQSRMHCGTLRYNIDPHNQFTDDELWKALEKVQLKNKVNRMPGRLSAEIESGGINFSGGQKQLFNMARALLHMNKIMILDEMTAYADKQTDVLIHTMLSNDFKDCTILHISHRIETLMHYDKIMMIGGGSVVEFDHPHRLLLKGSGHFHSVVHQLGRKEASWLTNRARQSYFGNAMCPFDRSQELLSVPGNQEITQLHPRRRKKNSSISLSEISRDTIHEEAEEPEDEECVKEESEVDVVKKVGEKKESVTSVMTENGEESSTEIGFTSDDSDGGVTRDMYLEFLKYGRIGRRWSSIMAKPERKRHEKVGETEGENTEGEEKEGEACGESERKVHGVNDDIEVSNYEDIKDKQDVDDVEDGQQEVELQIHGIEDASLKDKDESKTAKSDLSMTNLQNGGFGAKGQVIVNQPESKSESASNEEDKFDSTSQREETEIQVQAIEDASLKNTEESEIARIDLSTTSIQNGGLGVKGHTIVNQPESKSESASNKDDKLNENKLRSSNPNHKALTNIVNNTDSDGVFLLHDDHLQSETEHGYDNPGLSLM